MDREIIYMGNMKGYSNVHLSDHPQFEHINKPPTGYYFTQADTLAKERASIVIKRILGHPLDEAENMQNNILSMRRRSLNKQKAISKSVL